MIGLTLRTGRWRDAYEAAKGGPLDFVPVRISVGLPKFWPEAARFPYVSELAPVGLRHLVGHEFEAVYRARLDAIGAGQIRARLDEVASDQSLPLVLCCFEDVRAGARCHRTLAGTWLEANLGVAVPELRAVSRAGDPMSTAQLTFDAL